MNHLKTLCGKQGIFLNSNLEKIFRWHSCDPEEAFYSHLELGSLLLSYFPLPFDARAAIGTTSSFCDPIS